MKKLILVFVFLTIFTPISIAQKIDIDVNVISFENPVKANSLNISSSHEDILKVSIYNRLGDEVYVRKNIKKKNIQLSLYSLPSGEYFIKFLTTKNEKIRRLIKK